MWWGCQKEILVMIQKKVKNVTSTDDYELSQMGLPTTATGSGSEGMWRGWLW